jgi:hypothetical protein
MEGTLTVNVPTIEFAEQGLKDCIAALDGSHIPAFIPVLEQVPWRNRKGFLLQNVLAACNFNLEFVYILAGWKGSAHDRRVLDDALDKGFDVPIGKYYLADARYSKYSENTRTIQRREISLKGAGKTWPSASE